MTNKGVICLGWKFQDLDKSCYSYTLHLNKGHNNEDLHSLIEKQFLNNNDLKEE